MRNGQCLDKNPYIESLCKSFDLSPFGSFKKKENENWLPKSFKPQEPCKKCAKIRNTVKRFFRAKFETEKPEDEKTKTTSLNKQPKHLQMHIFKDHQHHMAVIESHVIHPVEVSEPNATVCFGCDQPDREPASRGPPIISPVCNGQISACPLGEVFKNLPEKVKKVIKIDRPRSLGPRKRVIDKDPPRETSVHETRKPSGR